MCSLQCKQGYETQFTNSCSFVSMETRVCPGVHVHVALFPGLPTVQFVVCKNGGGRPGPFYHMNDVSVYLGGQRGSNTFCRGVQTHFAEGSNTFCRGVQTHFAEGSEHILQRGLNTFWTRSGIFFTSWTFKTWHLGQKLQDKASNSFLDGDSSPP